MVKCQNCGNINTTESNFCRFCGTRFLLAQPASPQAYDYAPPRPYAWKTDEFQTQNEPRKPATSTQPPPVSFPQNDQAYQQPLVPWQGNAVAHSYLCPNCMNRYPPRHQRKVSTAGWIVFAVLLVTFFPLFWVGLLIREDAWVCQICKARLG